MIRWASVSSWCCCVSLVEALGVPIGTGPWPDPCIIIGPEGPATAAPELGAGAGPLTESSTGLGSVGGVCICEADLAGADSNTEKSAAPQSPLGGGSFVCVTSTAPLLCASGSAEMGTVRGCWTAELALVG